MVGSSCVSGFEYFDEQTLRRDIGPLKSDPLEEIQRALLAEPSYSGGFCDLAAASLPCRTIGGDFYDYLAVGGGGFSFALGDVAGKGPPAAPLASAA